MNPYRLIVATIIILTPVYSCKTDKKAQLEGLKKQHNEIAAKIKTLEQEIATEDTSKVDISKFTKVAVQAIKKSEFKHFIQVQGKLDGEENVDVYPEGMGVIQSIFVKNGDKVSKGQILAKMDDAAAKDQLKALETQYKFVKETFERQERLWAQKIGSEIQYLQTKSQKEAMEAQIAATKRQLEMLSIKSPINGTVEDELVKLGQTVSPQFPAYRVVNFTRLKVVAEVAESYAIKINVGDSTLIYFPDLKKELPAKISSASKYINPINRTFKIEIYITPEKDGFKANMITVVKINDYKSNSISVPINLIQSDPVGKFIYLASPGVETTKVQKAHVKTGIDYNGIIEITEGLKEGDKIITAGYLGVEENQNIRF